MKTWQCSICGWTYDEAAGMPEHGIPPGTRWGDVSPEWVCPDCGVSKSSFDMVELQAG